MILRLLLRALRATVTGRIKHWCACNGCYGCYTRFHPRARNTTHAGTSHKHITRVRTYLPVTPVTGVTELNIKEIFNRLPVTVPVTPVTHGFNHG